jgi:hypothetical protein
MPDTPDPVAAALDVIRADLRAAADSGLLGVKAGDYLPSALVRHCGDLLKAVDAALAFHEESDGTCGNCLDAYGDRIEWPCEEYRAITAALAGKETDDGQHPQDDQ